MDRLQSIDELRLAVLIPCYNEEVSVGATVEMFRNAIPSATIYVYDNNSVDNTREVAAAAGAVVRHESRQGKGNVVRRMFADVDADVYVLVDGDATYDAEAAPRLIKRLIDEELDFLNAARISEAIKAYRRGHRLGNRILSGLVESIFGRQFRDMLSGYKVFSRRFVKSFPAMSRGFEIETELTVHALELRMPCAEEFAPYKERPAGSTSKLSTYRDGFRILMSIASLVKNEHPFQFFGAVGFGLIVVAVLLSIPLVETYIETGLVPRIPTAVLVVGMVIVGLLSWFTGLILDVITTARQEAKRLAYLSFVPIRKEAMNRREP
jgi:glycosyltransferase involved in cell wall biosynthesis